MQIPCCNCTNCHGELGPIVSQYPLQPCRTPTLCRCLFSQWMIPGLVLMVKVLKGVLTCGDSPHCLTSVFNAITSNKSTLLRHYQVSFCWRKPIYCTHVRLLMRAGPFKFTWLICRSPINVGIKSLNLTNITNTRVCERHSKWICCWGICSS